MNQRIVLAVLMFGIALLNYMGAIDTPAIVNGIVQESIINPITDPHKMDLHVNGVYSNRVEKLFGLWYDGYEVKAVVLNSGSSGYVTIRCEAYDNSGQLLYFIDKFPHIKRNEQITVTCRFKDMPDIPYQFKVNITNQLKDS